MWCRRVLLLCLALIAAFSAACGSADPGLAPASSVTVAPPIHMPSSPVKIRLLEPTPGEVVHGGSLQVVVSISGGTIVPYTSNDVTPTTGHIHIYLDGQLYYMSFSTHATIPIQPGQQYQIYAEWVATDHFSFDPRDMTQPFYFTVES